MEPVKRTIIVKAFDTSQENLDKESSVDNVTLNKKTLERMLNDIVDNAIKTTDSPGSTSQVNFFAQTFPNFFDQTN